MLDPPRTPPAIDGGAGAGAGAGAGGTATEAGGAATGVGADGAGADTGGTSERSYENPSPGTGCTGDDMSYLVLSDVNLKLLSSNSTSRSAP